MVCLTSCEGERLKGMNLKECTCSDECGDYGNRPICQNVKVSLERTRKSIRVLVQNVALMPLASQF